MRLSHGSAVLTSPAGQSILAASSAGLVTLTLPDCDEEILPNVRWGRADQLFTPAYWASQAWLWRIAEYRYEHRLGTTLKEEAVACVLGGYGVPSDVAGAAFCHLRDRGLLHERVPELAEIDTALSEPFTLRGNRVRYRFAQQRSRHVWHVLAALANEEPNHSDDGDFRRWWLRIPGIGPKLSSWITRNWRSSDAVAVLDIHVYRAGVLAGLFQPGISVSHEYFRMEERYLAFAAAMDIRTSMLDALMWQHMRAYGRYVHRLPQLAH
jgi:N-glycosylase/DNA lyase